MTPDKNRIPYQHGYRRKRAVCKLPQGAVVSRPDLFTSRDSVPTSHVPDSSHEEYPNPESTHADPIACRAGCYWRRPIRRRAGCCWRFGGGLRRRAGCCWQDSRARFSGVWSSEGLRSISLTTARGRERGGRPSFVRQHVCAIGIRVLYMRAIGYM